MNESLENVKSLAPIIPLIKPIIETLFKPKIQLLSNWLNARKIDNEIIDFHVYGDIFEDYLSRTVEKSSIINTLIFPNQQINIENIYQPLTLIDNNPHQQEKIKIEAFPLPLFEKYQRILICDSAGMGKSTLSRFICLQAIKENLRIPVFIELRKINSKNTIIKELLKQFNPFSSIFDECFIMKLLSLGEFLIIFDGFDEISNDDKETVTQDIRHFVLNSGDNYFLLTSRPEGAISTFGDFKITNIKGLKDTEAFQLFHKYDKICNLKLSDSLISEIRGVNNQALEFLVNPFLVSLLYKTYSFKRDVPSRKSTFYNDVYSALYQDHDLSKDSYKRDKNSKLDIQDFRLVLREFANLTAKKGEVEYEKNKAVQYISECKLKLPFLTFKESCYVDDLLTAVPIFITEGNNIKWAHKSFQDYFAAEYITYHPKKDIIINQLIEKDVRKYENIIDLVIELDPNLIRQYVLPNILEKLINHYETTYKFPKIDEEELSVRRMITFDTKFWMNKVVIKDSEINNTSSNEFKRVSKFINDNYGITQKGATIYNDEYLIGFTFSNHAFFIQILGNKGYLGKSILKNKRLTNFDYEFLEENPTLIDDFDINSIYNNQKYFAQINSILAQNFRQRFSQRKSAFIPDYHFCKELLESINKEIEYSKNDYSIEGY